MLNPPRKTFMGVHMVCVGFGNFGERYVRDRDGNRYDWNPEGRLVKAQTFDGVDLLPGILAKIERKESETQELRVRARLERVLKN